MKENKKIVSWKYSVMGNRSGRNEEKQENRPLEILGDGEPERTKRRKTGKSSAGNTW